MKTPSNESNHPLQQQPQAPQPSRAAAVPAGPEGGARDQAAAGPERSALSRAIHGSPRVVAQRASLAAIFGPALQRRGARPEEPAPPNRTGLPDGLKAGVESLSGMDLSDVRVHANSSQPAALGALAYAQGNQIHLGPGQEEHLPHEAWHVVQQRQGRVQATMQAKGVPINDDAALEQEADTMGAAALAAGPAQRKAAENDEPLASAPPTAGTAPAQAVAQRAGTEAVMWDDYLTAYTHLMRFRRSSDIALAWRRAFYALEAQLYQAKAAGGGPAYLAGPVQAAHTAFMLLGVVPLPPPPDPNVVAAQALLVTANARWAAFSGNYTVNRGAWAGSLLHGPQPANYVRTPNAVLDVYRAMGPMNLAPWWMMASDSAPSGSALHRGGIDARGDFIFHL